MYPYTALIVFGGLIGVIEIYEISVNCNLIILKETCEGNEKGHFNQIYTIICLNTITQSSRQWQNDRMLILKKMDYKFD